MSVNLIEMAKNYLTPDVVEKLAQSTGIEPSQAKKTMAAAIPAVLAGVVQNASSEEGGGGGILDLLKQKAFDGSMLGNLGSSLGGGGFSQILETGKSILSTLFGGRLDSILNLISGATGTSRTAATGLMAAAAPMVMNLIGKVKNEQGLSMGGLREMLGSQKDLIAKFAPPGLANAMGLANLGSLGEMAGQVKDKISGAAERVKDNVGQVADSAYSSASSMYGNTTRRVASAAPDTSGAKRAALIALGCLAALAAVLWWRGRPTQVAETPVVPPVTVTKATPTPPALQGQPISALAPITLPNGTTLQLESGSTGARIIEFLKSAVAGQPAQRFLLKEVTFTTGEKAPAAESSAAIDRVATILKAFPKTQARIHAYAASGADINARDLAVQRAAQARTALIDRGVPADRITADTQPILSEPRGATNETRDTWLELELSAQP